MPRRKNQEPERPSTPPGGWRYLDAEDPEAWPQLVAFDLDYTLWDCWIDTHITPPVKRTGEAINQLVDRRGMPLEFYAEVPSILSELKRRKVHIAAASRTSAPELAREALGLLLLHDKNDKGATETVKAISYFNTMEIYPGSKLTHFQRIHRKTGIAYDQMLFFDDEHRNYETESLGVTMQLVPPKGTDRRLLNEGLALWRSRRGIKIRDA